jgi:type IV secretion system protein VirD4
MSTWGPSHERPAGNRRRKLIALVFIAALVSRPVLDIVLIAAVLMAVVRLHRRLSPTLTHPQLVPSPIQFDAQVARARAATAAGSVYLGAHADGGWRFSEPERAVLVLGPPRSGKTSAVIVPALLAHDGPAVSTSSKPDVMNMTAGARSAIGAVWQFDPTGSGRDIPGVRRLRWSPLLAATSWDGALLMARSLVTGTGVGAGTSDATHWAKRAQALLAPLLHAAALGGRDMRTVVSWVATHELQQPAEILQSTPTAALAAASLTGLELTENRERSSIFSAAADALDAYTATAALDSAIEPNFDPWRFVQSRDTIYIHAPAEQQHLAAPLVCGLLADIRRATYETHRRGVLAGRVLFALDELANIAPLQELPAVASEGGGQGLLLLGALQDLSQARARWGIAADGFFTLFGTKLILNGIADPRTLETVSVTLGEYDRQLISNSQSGAHQFWPNQRGQTVSTQRTRVLSPGEVANIPAGHVLHLNGVRWELLTLTPAFATEPWRTMTRAALR